MVRVRVRVGRHVCRRRKGIGGDGVVTGRRWRWWRDVVSLRLHLCLNDVAVEEVDVGGPGPRAGRFIRRGRQGGRIDHGDIC
jgi:hypothetical protein